ncbi:DUF6284 family protein [Kineosporia sp. NBRC 101731]|uniref:DUF6284 family protein n=1 Tax=Kineosporia sp. NBRC 101731 TaxID=3032199 RepID=UPI0024A4F0D7|nr:DUF6284 family protein [Kineosporia sp. NBRC 101731]GLY32423.1 hypothetical protein Kisp02_57880 [Kineosporia sp. NBRC 101731]
MRAVGEEPTRAELREIEAEMPLIEAGLAVVDAEIAIALADSHTDDLAWRRLRRAEARVTRRMQDFYAVSFGPLDGAA